MYYKDTLSWYARRNRKRVKAFQCFFVMGLEILKSAISTTLALDTGRSSTDIVPKFDDVLMRGRLSR